MRKIISQLHTNKDGIVCKDKTGREHVVFKKQGDLDGACATYCVIMNLLILRLIKDKIQEYMRSLETEQQGI
jgi:hypothetical protein